MNEKTETLLSKLRKELKNTSAKNPHKKETLLDKINDLKANLGSSEGKGGKGNYNPKNIKKMPTISREMAKGGEVKGYMGGGRLGSIKKNIMVNKFKANVSSYTDKMDKKIKDFSSKSELGNSLVEILGVPKTISLLKKFTKDKKAKGGIIKKRYGGSVKKKTKKKK